MVLSSLKQQRWRLYFRQMAANMGEQVQRQAPRRGGWGMPIPDMVQFHRRVQRIIVADVSGDERYPPGQKGHLPQNPKLRVGDIGRRRDGNDAGQPPVRGQMQGEGSAQ